MIVCYIDFAFNLEYNFFNQEFRLIVLILA